jgi:preprotein translocase subunit YajC
MPLAHGGGVPEALTVILPIVIFAAFMYVGRRNRRRAQPAPPPDPTTPREHP